VVDDTGAGCFPNDASSGGVDEIYDIATQKQVHVEIYDSTLPSGAAAGAQSRYDCFARRFNSQLATSSVPTFNYLILTNNHTAGTKAGSRTPQSMVADNDFALGTLVEALSKSPFWSSTAVMQTEDDTQVAGDHISALRDYVQVSSPWAQPGPNHQYGSMPSVLRTIEQVFGVRPISLFDRLAMPLHEAFLPSLSSRPNLSPYTAVKPLVPFNVNAPGAVGSALSATLDFSSYDKVDEQLLNAILYADARKQPLVLPRR
jgi:hypothetical protein